MDNKLIVLFVFLLSVLFVPRADAGKLDVTPAISLGAGWDSNIFNTESNEQADYVFRAVPKLTLTTSTPTLQMDLTGTVEGDKYVEHDELDSADTTKSIDFRLVRTGPRLTFSPFARYVDTDDIARREVAALIPVPGTPISDSLITERIRYKEYSGSLPFSYLLSKNVTLALVVGAVRRDYAENASGLNDSRTVTGYTSLEYQVTPRTSAGVFFDTGFNHYENRPSSRTYSGGLRGSYRATEYTTITASGGATLLRESTLVGDEVYEDWEPTGTLLLVYERNDFRANLFGSYTVSGGGSFGRTTNRGLISLGISDRFSESWYWDLSGSWQNNELTGGQVGAGENYDTASGTAALRFQALSWASVQLSGNLYRQNSNTSLVRNIDRETVQLDLILGSTYSLF